MDREPEQRETLLREPDSAPSTNSIGSNSTVVASPSSPVHHRPGYHRVASLAEQLPSFHETPSHQDYINTAYEGHGLGISVEDGQERTSIPRVPVGSKISPTSPRSPNPLPSPNLARLGGKTYRPLQNHPEGDEGDGASINPSTPSLHQTFGASSEVEGLRPQAPPENSRDFSCKSKKPIELGRGTWMAVTILMLSIYSTVLSGMWVMLAIKKLRYGHRITATGKLSPNTASVIFTAFAKSIELSFVTVFVAFLGQLLSARAINKHEKGITIAEMTMRSWVIQPGTMITHKESVRYAGGTFLGVFALLAALIAMLYTTASDALVTPKLKFGKSDHKVMYGQVATSFANTDYVKAQCTTPIQHKTDPTNNQDTCIQIQHAGEAYHNYMQYMATWVDNIDIGNGSSDLAHRPEPVAMLYDNTTIKGSWVNLVPEQNMTSLFQKYKRIVNNITMAMPHPGVLQAAGDPINNILQPQDLSGLGEYYLNASVPSPSINVLCANISHDELIPMVYGLWPTDYNNGTIPNSTTWPNDFNLTTPRNLTTTAVDDLFGFDNVTQIHPIFPNLPKPYNTVLNFTMGWGPNAMYVLATSATTTYTMCSLRVSLSPNCLTEYHATMSGGTLKSHCDDPRNNLAYSHSEPKAPVGKWIPDWVNVGSEWASSISLGDGIFEGDSSNARLLTQLIPTSPALDPSLPSISEALAVLAGNSLLLSGLNSPFIHYWNYSTTVNTLADPQYQAFNASLRTQAYASGGTEPWQGIFYIVLSLTFIINVCCLLYFGVTGSLVTDFIDPLNLFSLSLNSPPSAALDGACGAGPEKEHFVVPWHIELDRDNEHLYMESRDGGRKPVRRHKRLWSGSMATTEYELDGGESASTVARMYSKISRKRMTLPPISIGGWGER